MTQEKRRITINLSNGKGMEYVTYFNNSIRNDIELRKIDSSFYIYDTWYKDDELERSEDLCVYDDITYAIFELRKKIYERNPFEEWRLEDFFGKLGSGDLDLDEIEDYAENLRQFVFD